VIEVAGAVALLALAVVVASLVYLDLEPTGPSPVRNAVSQYGTTSYVPITVLYDNGVIAVCELPEREEWPSGHNLVTTPRKDHFQARP